VTGLKLLIESGLLVRPTRPALAAALVLGVTLLAGCGSAPGSESGPTTGGSTASSTATLAQPGAGLEVLTATGPVDHKTAPKISFAKTPVSTATVTRKVLAPGSGPTATKASTVTARLQIFNGTTGKILDNGFAADRKAETYRLGRQDLIKGFTEGLVGAQQGGRLAFTIPPAFAFGDQGNEQLGIGGKDTIVVVADVSEVRESMSQVDGTQQPSPAGLPTVEFPNGPTKEPKVTVPKTAAPKELKVITLIEGKGKAVAQAQMITAQYHGVLWKDGSVFDSSWQRGASADFPIGVQQVIPGWDKALVGKKVGSRVLIVVPPAEGYGEQGSPPKISGTDTLVFVVDILDAY
jgi:peptidylprolyl isomerase